MDYELDKRERILNAAAELIVRTGLQSPMSAIAVEAGVATGSLYNYFPSKEELILAVYTRVADAMRDDLIREVDRTVPYVERVEAYIRAYIEHIWCDPVRAMLYEVSTNSPLVMQKQVGALFRPFIDYSSAVFSEAQQSEAQRQMSPQLAGSFVRGAIRNALKRHRATGAPLSEDLKQRIVDMCRAAITA